MPDWTLMEHFKLLCSIC